MTTITIDRKLLEEIVELFDDAISTRYPHEILRDIRTALATPATAPDELERLKAESEERLQNCAALVAENEQLRWAVKDALAQLQRGDFADAESTLSVTAMKETP